MGANLNGIHKNLSGVISARQKFRFVLLICSLAVSLVVILSELIHGSQTSGGTASPRIWIIFCGIGLAALGLDWAADRLIFKPLKVLLLQVQAYEEQTHPLPAQSIGETQVVASTQNSQLPGEFSPADKNEILLLLQSLTVFLRESKRGDAVQQFILFMQQLPYTCALFDVGDDVLRLNFLRETGRRVMDAAIKGLPLPFFQGNALLQDRSMLLSKDIQDLAAFESLTLFTENHGIQHYAVFPIVVENQEAHIFVVSLDQLSDKPNGISELLFSATCFSTALQHQVDRFTFTSQLERYASLAQLSATLAAEFDLRQIYTRVHAQVISLFGKEISFSIAVCDEDRAEIEIPFAADGESISAIDSFPLGNGLTSLLITSRQSLLLTQDVENEVQRLGARIIGNPAKSWLGVPLLSNNQAIGAIVVQDAKHENRFTVKDQAFLEMLAPQVALALCNAHLSQQYSHLSEIFNREKHLLNELLDNIPEKVYFKDQNGVFLRASQSFLKSRGYANEIELIGHTDLELLPGPTGKALHQDDLFIIQSVKASIGEIVEHIADNGQSTWDLMTRIPLIEAEMPTDLLGIAQDITSLKIAEIHSTRQADRLYTASQIARDITGSLELKEILANAVNLICKRFEYEHASIFLLDAGQKQAVLTEAFGDAGQRMLLAGHSLAVGSQSLVGQATEKNTTTVANRVSEQENYYANPFLPNTRSESVIPLNIGERVLGALDVQSNQENAFTQDDLQALEILAGQLAMAIENSRLFTHTQDNLSKHRLLHEITSAAAQSQSFDESMQVTVKMLNQMIKSDWVALYLPGENQQISIQAAAGRIDPTSETFQNLQDNEAVKRCFSEGNLVAIQSDSHRSAAGFATELAFPVSYNDQILAVLDIGALEKLDISDNDYEMIGTLANTIGGTITTARLIHQIRSHAERQKQLFEITSKIRRFVDIESILRASAEEIGQTLQLKQAHIKIITELPDQDEDQFQPPSAGEIM